MTERIQSNCGLVALSNVTRVPLDQVTEAYRPRWRGSTTLRNLLTLSASLGFPLTEERHGLNRTLHNWCLDTYMPSRAYLVQISNHLVSVELAEVSDQRGPGQLSRLRNRRVLSAFFIPLSQIS